MLVDTSTLPPGEAVTTGGTYSGRLQLVKSGAVVIPSLIGVTRK